MFLRLVVFDLDGTVHRGTEALPYAGETVQWLLDQGVAVRYFTNNSAARPEAVEAKLRALGVPCEREWVYGTGRLAAEWCRDQGVSSAFVVGEPELETTLAEAGVRLVREGPAEAVVVGICRRLTYAWIEEASNRVRQGARFVATNRDPTYPLEGGRLQPGAGVMVAAVETASGVAPVVLGKPGPAGLLRIVAEAGVGVEETLVVGDRIDTDVACGRAAGCATYLVLTGATTVLPPGERGGADLAALREDWPGLAAGTDQGPAPQSGHAGGLVGDHGPR